MKTNCNHLTLKLRRTGDRVWYGCTECPQKFEAQPWDGKVKALEPPLPQISIGPIESTRINSLLTRIE